MSGPFAFFDLDGTLVSSNVVTQYAWYARRLGSYSRLAGLVVRAPALLAFELCSRRAFNVSFFALYRGLRRDWLERLAGELFEHVFRPHLYAGAASLLEADRSAGYSPVLVTGSLDFAVEPLARHLGFAHVISNRLVFAGGVATGQLAAPVMAGSEKVTAIRRMCGEHHVETAQSKAYSDSLSDLPMLEAVGLPAVVHPGRRLRRIARRRGWPILDLRGKDSRARDSHLQNGQGK